MPEAGRLGSDSPALGGRTLTLDALIARAQRGQLAVDKDTTIYLAEAGWPTPTDSSA